MALTNSGFNGTVTESAFAYMAAIGMADGVESSAAWAVTQGTGRQTSVAAQNGYAFAKGVLSKDTAAILTSIGTPTNGQWYLLCRRIDWTSDTVTVVALAHTTTSTTIPTAAPTGLPTMSTTPGAAWDQPLAWVWVRSSDTTMFLIDLRKLPMNDRVVSLELSQIRNVADLDALMFFAAADYEGRIIHADDMNANFQAMDGVWVQITDAIFGSTGARDTAFAKASAAYRVARARAVDTSTGLLSVYSGSAWIVQQGADDTGWVAATLAGAWLAFGGNHAVPGFRKVGTRVDIRGTAKSGAPGTVFTLPVGARPPFDLYYNVMANSGSAQISITAATGVVTLLGYIAGGTNAILSTHGMSFYTD